MEQSLGLRGRVCVAVQWRLTGAEEALKARTEKKADSEERRGVGFHLDSTLMT